MPHSELWTQEQLAQHWMVSEATLERWRSEGIGPVFVKLHCSVRYRIADIIAFEDECLRRSTSMSANVRTNGR